MMRQRFAFAGLAAALAASLLALDAVAHVLEGADLRFLERVASASRVEIELGELARQKGMRDEVKAFAERMVEDHTKAAEEVARLARSRGVEIKADPQRDLREDVKEMNALVGPEFDRAYMKRMLEEHDEALELFEKHAESAKDPDVRAFARRHLVVMQGHHGAALGTHGLTLRTDREYGSKRE